MSEDKKEKVQENWTNLDAMRPTQCSVGMIEVQMKMDELRERAQMLQSLEKYLTSHPIPAVKGPDNRMYLTDHHHMGLAMLRLSREWEDSSNPACSNPFAQCCFVVEKDFSGKSILSLRDFLKKMEQHGLCHPFDGNGVRMDAIPRSLDGLQDDSYRSLSGLARKAGAYKKVAVPFAEFKWADFFRSKIDKHLICKKTLAEAVQKAVVLAHTKEAKNLPGFNGEAEPFDLPSLDSIKTRLIEKHGAADQPEGDGHRKN